MPIEYPKEFSLKSKGFSPFRDLLGYYFTKVDKEYSQCVLKVKKKLLNPAGVLHGAAAYAVADSGMGAALLHSVNEDEAAATSEICIVYFKPVTSGTLVCDSRVIHKGRQVAVMESEIKNDGILVAKAIGTYAIFKRKG